MTDDTPILDPKDREPLFEKTVPVNYLKEYYDHIAAGKNLFIVVIADKVNQIFIRQVDPKEPGICSVFWRKQDAYVYASSCELPKDKTKIWETTLKDLIAFAEKMYNKKTKDENNPPLGFDVIAGMFHEGILVDIDLIWAKKRDFMV